MPDKFPGFGKVVVRREMFEEVTLFLLDALLETQDGGELRAWVAQLARFDVLEEQGNVADLVGLVLLFGDCPFLFGSGCIATTGRRAPTVVENEYRVVALPEVFVDQCLRPPNATDRILPADRVKHDVSALGMLRSEFLKFAAEAFSFSFQSTRRTDENPILCEELDQWQP